MTQQAEGPESGADASAGHAVLQNFPDHKQPEHAAAAAATPIEEPAMLDVHPPHAGIHTR
jgi:hypothetical protein